MDPRNQIMDDRLKRVTAIYMVQPSNLGRIPALQQPSLFSTAGPGRGTRSLGHGRAQGPVGSAECSAGLLIEESEAKWAWA